jgi:hypothetical protein
MYTLLARSHHGTRVLEAETPIVSHEVLVAK